MKSFKPPSQRDGNSPLGQALERAIDMVDSPFLKKAGPDGTIAYSRNGFPEIHQGASIDGYYSLGDLGVADEVYVSASPNARGTFANRGMQVDAGRFTVPSLVYVGRGLCIVPQETVNPQYHRFYFTRNGKKFEELDIMIGPLGLDVYSPAGGFLYRLPAAGTFMDGDERVYHFGISYLFQEDEENLLSGIPIYVLWRNGEWILGGTLHYPGATNAVPQVKALGPKTLLSLSGQYTFGADEDAVPAPFFSLSQDAGETWEMVVSGDLFDQVMALQETARTEEDETQRGTWLNEWRIALGQTVHTFQGALLNPGLFAGVLLLIDNFEWRTSSDPLLKGLRVVPITVAAGESPEEHDDLPFRSRDEAPINMFHYRGAVFMQTARASTHRLWRTENGADWELYNTLPFDSKDTGLISITGDGALVVPAYDDRYSLYELRTVDDELTWRRRGTIRAEAPAPDDDWLSLERFGVLNFVRDGLVNAPITPGAPWATDATREYAA
jgi:hypothetical protein